LRAEKQPKTVLHWGGGGGKWGLLLGKSQRPLKLGGMHEQQKVKSGALGKGGEGESTEGKEGGGNSDQGRKRGDRSPSTMGKSFGPFWRKMRLKEGGTAMDGQGNFGTFTGVGGTKTINFSNVGGEIGGGSRTKALEPSSRCAQEDKARGRKTKKKGKNFTDNGDHYSFPGGREEKDSFN